MTLFVQLSIRHVIWKVTVVTQNIMTQYIILCVVLWIYSYLSLHWLFWGSCWLVPLRLVAFASCYFAHSLVLWCHFPSVYFESFIASSPSCSLKPNLDSMSCLCEMYICSINGILHLVLKWNEIVLNILWGFYTMNIGI